MMTPDQFSKDMTYLQTLRIVARGLIQWPLHRNEVIQIGEAVKDAAVYLGIPFVRLVALVLLPISAPMFAWLVQVERRRTAAKKKARQEDAAIAAQSKGDTK